MISCAAPSSNASSGPSGLQRRILDALQADPVVNTTRVRTTASSGGLVTLEGSVHTYADKCSIEETVKRVRGVTSVRNRLEVRLTIADYRTDATLERILSDLFEFLARMPPNRPCATVSNGWVTLEGTVPHAYQKQIVENAVRDVAGVKGITNRIDVGPVY